MDIERRSLLGLAVAFVASPAIAEAVASGHLDLYLYTMAARDSSNNFHVMVNWGAFANESDAYTKIENDQLYQLYPAKDGWTQQQISKFLVVPREKLREILAS